MKKFDLLAIIFFKFICNSDEIYLWDVVVTSLSLLFLQLDRDTSHWSDLNTLHQVSNESMKKTYILEYVMVYKV